MSMFHLRDSLSESGFSDRADSVFSALGSGTVKAPDITGSSSNEPGGQRQHQPSFDQDQYNRSIKPRETNPKRRKFDSDFDFKHPAEFLRDDSRENRRSAGSGGGGRRRGEEDQPDSRSNRQRGGGGGGQRVHGRGRGRGTGGYTPDYKKNPNKWTKYTLSDVDNMTDRSNTAAAFDFLKSLKSSNNPEENEPAGGDVQERPVFKKPAKKINKSLHTAQENAEESGEAEEEKKVTSEKVRFVGSKQVMPECVVGIKPKEKKAKEKSKMQDKLVLSHLDEEEEDND